MFLRRHEQRLGRRQTAADCGAGATGLVAAAHRAGDRRPARNGQRLSEGRRDRGARPRAAAANQKQNRPFRRRCPPTLARQIRPFPRRCPPTRSAKPATRAEVSTDSVRSRPGRAPSASACEPYRELIAEALGRGRNAMAIWQDLVDDHGFTARYASVRRFVVTLRGHVAARGARRDHHRAGRRRPGRLRRRPDGAPPAARASTGARGSSS